MTCYYSNILAQSEVSSTYLHLKHYNSIVYLHSDIGQKSVVLEKTKNGITTFSLEFSFQPNLFNVLLQQVLVSHLITLYGTMVIFLDSSEDAFIPANTHKLHHCCHVWSNTSADCTYCPAL